jgi:hypothetical protein
LQAMEDIDNSKGRSWKLLVHRAKLRALKSF